MDHITPDLIAAIAVSPLCVLLLAAVRTDIKGHRIPNRLVFFGAGLGLLLNSVLPGGFGFISSLPGALGPWKALAGLSLGFVIPLPLYMLRAMGAGDVKLISMVGAFLGPNAIIGTILVTFVVGGVLTVLIVTRNHTLGLLMKNLHVMFMSTLIKATVLREMPKVDAAPVSAGKLPYGVVIALGTFMYIALERGGHMDFLKYF